MAGVPIDPNTPVVKLCVEGLRADATYVLLAVDICSFTAMNTPHMLEVPTNMIYAEIYV